MDVSVYDYGGSASSDSASAILLMEADLGYVLFPQGNTLITSNVEISTSVYFDDGAYITVEPGATVTIQGRINTDPQWVFRGDGEYILGNDGVTGEGENSRDIHASLFGAFPLGVETLDQAPFINKALVAMGNGRESRLIFDIGNYTINSQVLVQRCAWIVGAGTRRTVFKFGADGFSGFKSANVGAKLTGVQFECYSSMLGNRASPFVELSHDLCEAYDINMGQAKKGLVISGGNGNSVSNIRASYGSNMDGESSLIEVTGGHYTTIDGVLVPLSSSYGPTFLVSVAAQSDMSVLDIKNIKTINPATPIRVRASGGSINQLSIDSVSFGGFAGAIPGTLVHLLAENDNSISSASIRRVLSNNRPGSAVMVQNSGSGDINVLLDEISITGSEGSGIQFIRSGSGDIFAMVGSTVNVSSRENPITYSGTIENVKIAAEVIPDRTSTNCYNLSIPVGGVAEIDLKHWLFLGGLEVYGGSAGSPYYGHWWVRSASSPTFNPIGTPSSVFNTYAGSVMTGSTGASGKINIGSYNGKLTFENRTGNTQGLIVVPKFV